MRLMVTLQEQEQNALWKVSELERRDPRDQAALFIHEGLQRRGLLPADLPQPPAEVCRVQPTA